MIKRSDLWLLVALLTLIIVSLYFNKQNTNLLGRDSVQKEVNIILAGDVMLGRTVTTKSLDDKANPKYPFLKVADRLTKADLVFVNLEAPIIEDCPRDYESLIFCADPKMVGGLGFANINVVTLANNHSLNYGKSGLEQTVDILRENDIEVTGLGGSVVKEVRGTKFSFLGFDFLTKLPKETDYQLVAESSKKVDVLIVGVHWGAEYQPKANKYQKDWARRLVEAGADVVVGHHSHWVQEVEYINGKPIYYSLGNFVFDQMWSKKTREGLVVELAFRGSELLDEKRFKTYMSSWAQPEFVSD